MMGSLTDDQQIRQPTLQCIGPTFGEYFKMFAYVYIPGIYTLYKYLLLFPPFFRFFDFDLDVVCFILSFSCGYYPASSFSLSVWTRLAYDMYLVLTYAELASFFLRSYTICFSYCVYYLLFLYFPCEVIFHSRVVHINLFTLTDRYNAIRCH